MVYNLNMKTQTNNPENTGKNQDIERNPDGTFKPGVSGNPAGKPKGAKHLTSLLFEALQKKARDKNGKETESTYQDLLIQRILKDAIEKGNTSLIHLCMNYIDGMPQQGIDLTSNGESVVSSNDVDVMEMAKLISKQLKAKKTT